MPTSVATKDETEEQRLRLLPAWARRLIAELKNEVTFYAQEAGYFSGEAKSPIYVEEDLGKRKRFLHPREAITFELDGRDKLRIRMEEDETGARRLRIMRDALGSFPVTVHPVASNVITVR